MTHSGTKRVQCRKQLAASAQLVDPSPGLSPSLPKRSPISRACRQQGCPGGERPEAAAGVQGARCRMRWLPGASRVGVGGAGGKVGSPHSSPIPSTSRPVAASVYAVRHGRPTGQGCQGSVPCFSLFRATSRAAGASVQYELLSSEVAIWQVFVPEKQTCVAPDPACRFGQLPGGWLQAAGWAVSQLVCRAPTPRVLGAGHVCSSQVLGAREPAGWGARSAYHITISWV